MISLKPKDVYQDVIASESKLETYFASHQAMVERYHGSYFKGRGNRFTAQDFENLAHEWLSLISIQMIGGHPRWIVKSRIGRRGDENASAIRHGLTRWAVDTQVKSELRKLFVDFSFRQCIGLMRRNKIDGPDLGPKRGPPHRPALERVSLRGWVYDPLSTDHAADRWRGHKSIWDIEEILEDAKQNPDAGWDETALRNLSTKHGEDRLNKLRGVQGSFDTAERPEIVLFEMWVPEEDTGDDDFTPENGFYGVVHTYAFSDAKRSGYKDSEDNCGLIEVREPRPFYGPSFGPYLIGGQDYVPDEAEPLSQFVALEGQLRALNLQSNVMQREIEAWKRIAIVGGGARGLPAKIKNSKHGNVIPHDGFKADMVKELTTGGADADSFAMFQFALERTNKGFGINEAAKGNVQTGVTATADAQAAAGTSARVNKMRDHWKDFLNLVGRSAGEYLFTDNTMLFPLGQDVAEQLGKQEPWVMGGAKPGETFADLELDIDPISIVAPDDQSNQTMAMQRLNVYMQIAPLAIQFPFFDWAGILDDVGTAMHAPEMGEHANFELAQAIGMAMLGQQLAAGENPGQGPEGSKPKLSGDVRNTRPAPQPTQPKRQALPGQMSGAKAGKPKKAAKVPA